MTEDFERVETRVDAYARRLLAAGWHPEDVAAAFMVEGVALSNAAHGRSTTAFTLNQIAQHLEPANAG